MTLPDRIIIEDGELKMRDGSDLKEYVKQWQSKAGIQNGTAVNISDHKWLGETVSDAMLARNFGA